MKKQLNIYGLIFVIFILLLLVTYFNFKSGVSDAQRDYFRAQFNETCIISNIQADIINKLKIDIYINKIDCEYLLNI